MAEANEVVITMLPNGEVVQEVALGRDGLVHGWREGALLLDTSSCQPWLTQQTGLALAQRGGRMGMNTSWASIAPLRAGHRRIDPRRRTGRQRERAGALDRTPDRAELTPGSAPRAS